MLENKPLLPVQNQHLKFKITSLNILKFVIQNYFNLFGLCKIVMQLVKR